MSSELWILLVSLLGLHLLALKLLISDDLPPFGRRLAIALTAVHVVLLGLYSIGSSQSGFWGWYLNYKFGEYNPSATFSTVQYLLTGFTAGAIAALGKPRGIWHRLYWAVIATTFIYLAFDEYFVLHETISNWKPLYVLGGLVIAVVSLPVWIPRSQVRHLYFIFVGGMIVAGAGGVGLEVFAGGGCMGLVGQGICAKLPILEELLENIGVLTTLLSVLAYLHKDVTITSWAHFRRMLLVAGLGGAVALLGNPWIIPNLEARSIARPISLTYLENEFEVIGYRVSPTTSSPGDLIHLNVYWRTNGNIDGDYGFSAQLIHPTQAIPVAQVNKYMRSPKASDAFPETVYRTELKLNVPIDIPSPVSYWLTLTTWKDRQSEFAMQPIEHTDRQLITADMAILQSLPVLGQNQTTPMDHVARFDFQNGFSLVGYNIVSADDGDGDLMLQFAWETQEDIEQDLIQFVHFFDATGEFVFGLDQPPFDGTFPTSDWPRNQILYTEWRVDLPEDLPDGKYQLSTGLYDSITAEREQITDNGEHVIHDNVINLGTFDLILD